MNYFAHALPHLHRPHFMAGTALPDWLSVVDRKVRLRPRGLEPFVNDADSSQRELALGALQHLQDDDWFHRTRGFAEVTATVGILFRDRLQGSDGYRCGFLGHIVTEMLLDATLIARYPEELREYYAILGAIDGAEIQAMVERFAGRTIEKFDWFYGLFLQERILDDYADNARLLRRLNQVLKRVKLTPLPDTAADWLAEARQIIDSRCGELLPEEHFPWPERSVAPA